MSELTRQQWDELEFDALGLLRHLLRWDYRRAAVGLLQDLFKELHDREHGPDAAKDTLTVLPSGTTMQDELVVLYRERLMEALGDTDGTMLKDWIALYEEYRYKGTDHEREAFMSHRFLQVATTFIVNTSSRIHREEDTELE